MISSNTSPPGSLRTEEEQLVALFAAANMATQASDERMASESNKTTLKFCEMMEAIQASMKSNTEEMHQLRERLEASEQRNKELEAVRQAEKRAAEQRAAALEAKVDYLSLRLGKSENAFANHFHKTTICCSHSGYNCSCTPWQTQGPSLPQGKESSSDDEKCVLK